jgi:hypothetical protein
MEIFICAGLCAPVGGEVPENLALTLQRRYDKGRHSGATKQLQHWGLYATSYGFKAQDE